MRMSVKSMVLSIIARFVRWVFIGKLSIMCAMCVEFVIHKNVVSIVSGTNVVIDVW